MGSMTFLLRSLEKNPIRQPTKPSTAKCDLDIYTNYLIAEPKISGCSRLGQIMDISHDSTNRFLLRENYEPKDLFNEVKKFINLTGGTLSADDTIIEKLYSNPSSCKLIGYYWSGKHKKVIKGINLITLYYTDPAHHSVPINYRLYNKEEEEGKTKNEYLREMVEEVIEWGINPKTITTDSWYSSKDNLKFFRDKKLNFLVGIAKNRQIKIPNGRFCKVEEVRIPDEGLKVYLKEFGWVKVFQRIFKNEKPRYYVIYQIEESNLELLTTAKFRCLCSIHWGIECYHRALKQLCGLGKFLVRTSQAIATHIFCSLRAFCQLELMRIQETIFTWYEIQRELYLKVAREFIIKRLREQKNTLAA